MSIQAVAWAFAQQRVTRPAGRLLLIALADTAHEDGTDAWATAKRLAVKTGLSERTVQRGLEALSKYGVIRRGNQNCESVQKIPANRRPVVWDLDMPKDDIESVASRHDNLSAHPANGTSNSTTRDAKDPALARQALADTPGNSVGTPQSARPDPVPGPREELGYTKPSAPSGTLARALEDRQLPPAGRQRDFDAEFKSRFGTTPQEAQALREKVKA